MSQGRCLWGIQQGRGAYSPDSGDTSGDDPVVDWFLRRKVFTVPLHANHLDLEEPEGAWALRVKMDRAYDVFEVLSDGMSIWKATIDDEEQAMRKLDELAAGKSAEFRLVHRPTMAIIATRNSPKSR
jgi:hypothetical protein